MENAALTSGLTCPYSKGELPVCRIVSQGDETIDQTASVVRRGFTKEVGKSKVGTP
jgi:hypothetical protein